MGLQQLVAAIAFQTGEEVVLDHLHGDRGSALLRCVAREVRQRGADQRANVDAVVVEELFVFDDEERLHHLRGHVGVRNRLRVLQLEHGDFFAIAVIHIGALGKGFELGEHDRNFFVRVHNVPHPGSHGHDDSRDHERAGRDDREQTWKPAGDTHSECDSSGRFRPIRVTRHAPGYGH